MFIIPVAVKRHEPLSPYRPKGTAARARICGRTCSSRASIFWVAIFSFSAPAPHFCGWPRGRCCQLPSAGQWWTRVYQLDSSESAAGLQGKKMGQRKLGKIGSWELGVGSWGRVGACVRFCCCGGLPVLASPGVAASPSGRRRGIPRKDGKAHGRKKEGKRSVVACTWKRKRRPGGAQGCSHG